MFWNLISRRRAGPLIHLFMLAILALYTLLGAICFCAFEAGPEREKLARWALEDGQRKLMARNRLLSDMQFFFVREVNVSRLLSRDFQRSLELYDTVMAAGGARLEGKRRRDGLNPKWSLWGGLYFAGSIYTTIGYGDIVVETVGGKCFAVLYALLGIPLVITVLNVWGGGLFQLVQILWRRHILRLMRSLPLLGQKKRGVVPAGVEEKVPEFGHLCPADGGKNSLTSGNSQGIESNGGAFERQQRAKLPLKLAFILLLVWILFCATIFTFFQNWTFFDAAYFFFISLTTIGLGDYTAEHKVACAYFLLILIGLSVVSMSLSIIQLQIEGVFHKIIHSIDADFKENLIVERKKISISTSIGVLSLQSQQAIQPLPRKVPKEEEDTSDALQRYRGSMTKSERLLAQMLMSQPQRKMLNEKLRTRRRMKNAMAQTDEKLVDAQVQTDQLKSLRPFASLFAHSVDEADSGEEGADGTVPVVPVPVNRRANTFSGANKEKPRPNPHGKAMGNKRLYIYNTGD